MLPPSSAPLPPFLTLAQARGAPAAHGAAALTHALAWGSLCFELAPESPEGRANALSRAARDALLAQCETGAVDATSLSQSAIKAWLGFPDRAAPASLSEARALYSATGPLQGRNPQGLSCAQVSLSTRFDAMEQMVSPQPLLLAQQSAQEQSWERIGQQWAQATQERAPTNPESLDPRGLEARLAPQAQALMARFGIPSLRLGGFPDADQASSSLSRLESALAALARACELPDQAMGLDGVSIHLRFPTEQASAYHARHQGANMLCLSAGSGFEALSHEWFHAFDAALALRVDPSRSPSSRPALTELAESAFERQALLARDPALGPLLTCAEALMREIRAPASSSASNLQPAPELQETHAMRHERLLTGVFDRFYAPRIPLPGLPQAREGFSSLSHRLLRLEAKAMDLAAWRDQHLGPLARQMAHYDAIALAQARIYQPTSQDPSASVMQRFALLADEHLQTQGGKWINYASCAPEIAARCFEGNLGAKAGLGPAQGGSFYWPQGAERGALSARFSEFMRLGSALLHAPLAQQRVALQARLGARRETSEATQAPPSRAGARASA